MLNQNELEERYRDLYKDSKLMEYSDEHYRIRAKRTYTDLLFPITGGICIVGDMAPGAANKGCHASFKSLEWFLGATCERYLAEKFLTQALLKNEEFHFSLNTYRKALEKNIAPGDQDCHYLRELKWLDDNKFYDDGFYSQIAYIYLWYEEFSDGDRAPFGWGYSYRDVALLKVIQEVFSTLYKATYCAQESADSAVLTEKELY
jgi:hypothetical protein